MKTLAQIERQLWSTQESTFVMEQGREGDRVQMERKKGPPRAGGDVKADMIDERRLRGGGATDPEGKKKEGVF